MWCQYIQPHSVMSVVVGFNVVVLEVHIYALGAEAQLSTVNDHTDADYLVILSCSSVSVYCDCVVW